jgi:hypothetical protein
MKQKKRREWKKEVRKEGRRRNMEYAEWKEKSRKRRNVKGEIGRREGEKNEAE